MSSSEIYDLFEGCSKAVMAAERRIEDINLEINRWKKGKAQDYYELYNLPTEYGDGLSAMRDWVLEHLEIKKGVVMTELAEKKERAVDKLKEALAKE